MRDMPNKDYLNKQSREVKDLSNFTDREKNIIPLNNNEKLAPKDIIWSDEWRMAQSLKVIENANIASQWILNYFAEEHRQLELTGKVQNISEE